MFLSLNEKPIIAQIGFQFRDPVRNVQVRDGLQVTARNADSPGRTVQAFQTPSGNYVVRGLPGLHDAEYPTNARTGQSERTRIKLIIEVRDLQHYFLPVAFLFDEEIPLVVNGSYRNWPMEGSPSSPPEPGLPVINLFSAPTRPLRPGMTAVRCGLKDFSTKKGASHAVIEVTVKGKKWFGMADSEGNAAVYFPYPTVDAIYSGSSPPLPVSRPLSSQRWQIVVRINCSPGTLSTMHGTNSVESRSEVLGEKALPELGSILRQQQARIWTQDPESTAGATADFELIEELIYGQDIVLRTANTSELLIETLPTSP